MCRGDNVAVFFLLCIRSDRHFVCFCVTFRVFILQVNFFASSRDATVRRNFPLLISRNNSVFGVCTKTEEDLASKIASHKLSDQLFLLSVLTWSWAPVQTVERDKWRGRERMILATEHIFRDGLISTERTLQLYCVDVRNNEQRRRRRRTQIDKQRNVHTTIIAKLRKNKQNFRV